MEAQAVTMILTVGTGARGTAPGLAQALVQTLHRRKPARFLLVPARSRDSRALADLVLKGLDKSARATFVPWLADDPYRCIEYHDQLESARAAVREVIRAARERFPRDLIVVNPGSGTRPMSAGATLAALDEGVGRVEFGGGPRGESDGPAATALPALDAARWRAAHETAAAAVFWEQGRFENAGEMLATASARVAATDEWHHRCSGVAHAALGFGAKEAARFADAERHFREALRCLPADQAPGAAGFHGLRHDCKEAAERCARMAKAQGNDRDPLLLRECIAEFVDASVRAGRLERHDQAIARLLRAIEMELQRRLAEATHGEVWNGRPVKPKKVPEALRAPGFLAQIQRTELPRELSPEEVVHALLALGDASLEELRRDLTDFRQPSEWRQTLAAAQSSVAVRGWTTLGKTDHKNLRRVANRFLQMNLSEAHPVPAYDRRWLE